MDAIRLPTGPVGGHTRTAAQPMPAMIKKLVTEPLLHFLLLGLGFFVLHGLLSPAGDTQSSHVIEVNRKNLLTYYQYRSRAFNADEAGSQIDSLSTSDLNQLIDDYVREEALYREALRLGLDRNDYVVKRRLVQSVEFIADGVVAAEVDISDVQVQSYFETHKEDYFEPAAITFTHVFFGQRQRGDKAAQAKAEEKLVALNADQVSFSEGTAHGDRFLYHVNYVDRDAAFVASHFGNAMANAMFELEPAVDLWRGPFESPYGYHLVLLTRLQVGRNPPLEEVKERVRDDALRVAMRKRKQVAIDSIVRNFTVNRTFKAELAATVDGEGR